MRKVLLLPLAGLLVIGGATAAFAAPSAVSDTARQVSNAATVAGSLLAEVLADLVADGVITQEQSDAIVGAVDTRVEEKRTEMRELRELVAGFLEDGVVTAEELEQLPEDHPWRNLDDFLADGQLTIEELRQLSGPFRHHHVPRGGGWGGPGGDGFPGGLGGPGVWLVPPDAGDGTDGDDGTDSPTDSESDSPTDSDTDEQESPSS